MLPLDPAIQPMPAEPDDESAPVGSTGLRILVADDNDDGRDLLEFLLTAEGHTVTAVSDGPAAVAAAEGFRPDIAILDIGMPGMSGYAVAETLRQLPATSSTLLVALSGLGQDEDKARAAAAGFARHFTKPVDVNALRSFLATVQPGEELA